MYCEISRFYRQRQMNLEFVTPRAPELHLF